MNMVSPEVSIAVRHRPCGIRIIDQVKAYSPGHRVTANDVRALLGVLSSDLNVSKGVVTTTADLAPGILQDRSIRPFLPYRLELKNGLQLRTWLLQVAGKGRPGATPDT
jgi:restriction system protein